MESQNTGQRAILSFLSFGEADPFYDCSEFPIGLGLGVNAVTFQLQYDDGYVVYGSGKLLVTSYGGLGLPGFGELSVIAHLTVKSTNQPGRPGTWPRIGDQLRGAGELKGTKGEGAYRLVRR
jgi:hypothetical protein